MMGIDCSFPRAEMATALAKLASVTPTRTTLPVLSHVRISPEGDACAFVRLEATDLDRRAETTLKLAEPCEAFDPICLPLDTLLAAAKAFTGVSGRLAAGKGESVVFSSVTSKLTLPSLPADEFPEMWMAEGDGFAVMTEGDGAALLDALARVRYAACTEISKPGMLGVSFGGNGTGVRVVAVSGPEMALEAVPGWAVEIEPTTIASPGVDAMLRFFAGADRLTVEASNLKLRFSGEAGSLVVPINAAPFPNVDHVIPRDSSITIRVDRGALYAAIQRAALTFREPSVRLVVLDVASGAIAFHADGEAGVSDEVVAAQVEGPNLCIGFDATLLSNALKSLSAETVVVEMSHPERAAILRDEGATDGSMRLVMPRRMHA